MNQLRVRAGLAQVTNWNPDPNPQRYVTQVHHDHITQLRTKLEEALNALHLPIGTYAHSGPNYLDTIYAIDFQELRDKIKGAWTALAASAVNQSYDGDGLRVKKSEFGATTYYLRSTVLGGQVLAEIDGNAVWQRGYVYAGGNLMAVQQGGVFWTYEDPVTKSKRVCDVNGNIVSTVELDPWGADTNRSASAAFQPRKFTSYDRDGNGSDEAMFRRYNRWHSRFDQPDPYEGSYDLSDPQSLNRYAYVQNDPVSFVDPTGLLCWARYIVTTTYDSQGKVISEVWHYLYTYCDSHYAPAPTRDIPGGGPPGRVTQSQIVTKQATPEQVRKQKLEDCLTKAEAKMDKAGMANLDRATNPLKTDVIDLGTGIWSNRVFGAGAKGAGANAVLGIQAAKGVRAYWGLMSPYGFMAEYGKDLQACHALYGY